MKLYVEAQYASSPPRGWNSYDSFSWTISEKEFLDSAQFISDRLLSSGYEYVVVDYLWYRRKVEGADADSSGFDVIDEWGRMVPDPDRWPSSVNGNGFTEVANKGEAFEEGRKKWTAQDIGIKERPCSWMPHGFMARAGAAFLRSLYTQYAEWGVDLGN
uniref:Alpha-galactosidase n=1 Tax=Quercus lobata TaxID=97700 RepID=A0A7N2LA44_QUELO